MQLALCDGDRERCVSEAALKFLRIVDSGRQRDGRTWLAEIIRAINLVIRPMEDLSNMARSSRSVCSASEPCEAPARVHSIARHTSSTEARA